VKTGRPPASGQAADPAKDLPTLTLRRGRPARPKGRKMSSNPLHFLITTLTQFHDAVWKCQTATTGEERGQAQSAWNEVRKSFWPKYHRPAEAIRELADPALAWCSRKGFRGKAHTATIETAASFITQLAMRTCPCAYPEIYANKDDLWEQWHQEGEMLLAADDARRILRRLAALTGEAWQPNGQGEGDGTDRDQGGAGSGEEAARGGKKRRKCGRPTDTDPKADQRIFDAWQSGQHRTYEDLARLMGKKTREVSAAIDRHRKRLEREGK